MGETLTDRASMLQVLATMDPHPESVPVNGLVAVEGTPLEGRETFEPLELVRMVATARILMPHSRVRLSAGRESMTREAQILCLQAGADSIFYGDTLLTTGNPDVEADRQLLADAGVQASWQEQGEAASLATCSPISASDAAWKLATPLCEDYGTLAKFMWARTFDFDGPALCYL